MGRLVQFLNSFLKNGLSGFWKNVILKRFKLIFAMCVPRIDVLAHHNPVDADVPHHRGAMATQFKVVVDLLAFVGALNGSASLVNGFPLFGLTACLGKQAEIILAVHMKRATKFRSRTRFFTRILGAASKRTAPLLAVLGVVVPIGFHLFADGANGNASR